MLRVQHAKVGGDPAAVGAVQHPLGLAQVVGGASAELPGQCGQAGFLGLFGLAGEQAPRGGRQTSRRL